MRIKNIFVVALIALSSPASAKNSLWQYGMGLADAKFSNNGANISLYVHPKEDLLLLQPQMKDIAKVIDWDINQFRAAAEAFVRPVGCGIPTVYALTKAGGTWEAEYLCPKGIDLRKLIIEQRSDLKKGIPLHL